MCSCSHCDSADILELWQVCMLLPGLSACAVLPKECMQPLAACLEHETDAAISYDIYVKSLPGESHAQALHNGLSLTLCLVIADQARASEPLRAWHLKRAVLRLPILLQLTDEFLPQTGEV